MNTKMAVDKPRERSGTDSSFTDPRRNPQARLASYKDRFSVDADGGGAGMSPDEGAHLFDACHPPGAQ